MLSRKIPHTARRNAARLLRHARANGNTYARLLTLAAFGWPFWATMAARSLSRV